ncbi:MAG: hypothetical protein Q4B60_03525 [Erysipelotrichaceae bacterium]|nr:hypothetical protein [Erysipelotrichaceae bacterium]
MKNLFEYLTTMIITMILVFVFTGIIGVSLQMLNARTIHNEAINKIQASYYLVSADDLNRSLKEGWRFEVKELSSVKTRKDMEVILHYSVSMPFFKSNTINGRISGYVK